MRKGGRTDFQNCTTNIVTTCSLGKIEKVDCIKYIFWDQLNCDCCEGSSSTIGNSESLFSEHRIEVLADVQRCQEVNFGLYLLK